MANRSSDSDATERRGAVFAGRRDSPLFMVAPDADFLARVRTECASLPEPNARHDSIADLVASLAQFDRIQLAFVLLVERSGDDIDIPALRALRLEFPQVVIVALLEACDQRCSLRLQSVGVHGILLPPFSEVDVRRELAGALPNVPQFKRNTDLMRRAQARIDFLLPSDLSYVLGINHEISLLLKEFDFPPQEARVNIPLACDEAITNAIVHGNGSDRAKRVNVQIYVSHSRFRMRVIDQGAGFDAEAVADPRAGENVMKGSGRGVFLMRSIMDSVVYKEGGRVLEIEKRNPDARNGAEA